MISKAVLAGLVLAGGQSRRMQVGSSDTVDKGLLTLHKTPLIELAVRHLADQVNQVYISANRNLDAYSRYGTVIQDDPSLGVNAGPLVGIASALARISEPWLMVVPVDVPVLPADVVRRLCEAAAQDSVKLAYAQTDRAQPLCMLLHRDLAGSLRRFLLDGGRKVQAWQQQHDAKEVVFAAQPSAFFNVNTQNDLNAMHDLIQGEKLR